MEVSRLRSGRLSRQKKNYPFNAAWTSECSWRATVAPAGWTSSGLRAPHTGGWAGGPDGTCRGHWLIPLLKKKIDYISRLVHVILAPVHAILLCIVQARNSSNFVRHPYAGALLSSARADVKIFIRRHYWRNKSSGPCTVVIPVQSTVREFHTSLPCRRTSPLDTSCNSLLGNCTHTKKKQRVISGAMLLEKKRKTRYVLSLYLPKHSNLPNINARLREHPVLGSTDSSYGSFAYRYLCSV